MESKKKPSIEALKSFVDVEINNILKVNLFEISLKEEEGRRLNNKKNQLRDALNNCGLGDIHSKNYVKKLIKEIIIEKSGYSVKEIAAVLSFDDHKNLSVSEKFDILLYHYKKNHKYYALAKIIDDSKIIENMTYEKGYELCEEDINRLFFKKIGSLRELEKLDIIVQKIYSKYRGLGAVDEIRDMKIDGISGGVSGKEGSNNSIWIFFRGNTVHLSFLEFENELELERVCMNIYKYGNPGQLSKNKGYIVNEMKDRSRVVVVRPPFSESFAFFVRKFDSVEKKEIKELITDKGNDIAEEVLKFLIKGCQVTAVTGAQGSGKTTLLMSLIKFISPVYTLRIQEMSFELHLRDIYPERNILSFRETDSIDTQEGLDIQKKTDGSVNILGEVASIEVASHLVQMTQVGSIFTIFTHHAKTTENLIKYMRNSLLSSGIFKSEKIAIEQVVDAIRFDIHMEKDVYGHRYIERISEIIPAQNEEKYIIKDIMVLEDGEYKIKERISENTSKEILKRLDRKESYIFEKIFVQ